MKIKVFMATILLSGCGTVPSQPLRYDKSIQVLSDVPGLKVELNNGYVCDTPCNVTIPTYRGRFIGSSTISVIPPANAQFIPSKYFSGGHEISDFGDFVPDRVFFDSGLADKYKATGTINQEPNVDKSIQVLSEPSGAKVEVNDDYICNTPCLIHAPTNKDRFVGHTTVRVLPVYSGQFVSAKNFGIGEAVPNRLFFDLSIGPKSPTMNLNIHQQ